MTNRHQRGIELESQRLRKARWVMIGIGVLVMILIAEVACASGNLPTSSASRSDTLETKEANHECRKLNDNLRTKCVA